MDVNLRRRQRRDKIYDKIHKGFVNTCISVTLIGSVYLGYKVYEYFRYIRPLHKAQYQLTQQELLDEGKSTEASVIAKFST